MIAPDETNQTLPDGPRAAPGDVLPDGRIMTADVGGMPGYPAGRGAIWVTPDQAEQGERYGWRKVNGDYTAGGMVQVTR